MTSKDPGARKGHKLASILNTKNFALRIISLFIRDEDLKIFT